MSHSRLVSIGSSCSSLYCSALCSVYCRSTTSPWTSRLIFFHRAPFRWVFLESMLGSGGVLREKIASSKLMGLYGAPRDVAPLFQSSLPSLESEGREFFCIFGSCTRGGVHAASRVLVISWVYDTSGLQQHRYKWTIAAPGHSPGAPPRHN